jgi:hypothetical protein
MRIDSPDDIAIASVQSALSNFPLLAFSDGLVSLDDTVSGRALFGKASRTLESARRQCDLVLKRLAQAGADIGLAPALHVWLVGELDTVEDFVQATPMVSLRRRAVTDILRISL